MENMEEVSKEQVLGKTAFTVDNKDIGNIKTTISSVDILRLIENAPQKTVPRYWHTDDEKKTISQLSQNTSNKQTFVTPYRKINNKQNIMRDNNKPDNSPKSDTTLFKAPPPKGLKATIEVPSAIVELESSDEDEVVEIALPPKPTITIDSSDEEEAVLSKNTQPKNTFDVINKPGSPREVLSSPVPSTVSSVSDDFIRSDCIALNISSKNSDKQSFDFGLHGSEFSDQSTPSRKRRKKKSKDNATKSPALIESPEQLSSNLNECFATPKNKAKRKKKKKNSKTLVVDVDGNDSDSSQSVDKSNEISYVVTNTSLPSVDVYESDSNQSEIISAEVTNIQTSNITCAKSLPDEETGNNYSNETIGSDVIDLTDPNDYNDLEIPEEIVLTNVTGIQKSQDIENTPTIRANENSSTQTLGSTKVPQILFENLDFDNLKGFNSNKRKKYSMSELRSEMDKFYNESWGGENFNHREIQKSMSRDKKLWLIDPKDRWPSARKKPCSICNQYRHSEGSCPHRMPICHMCGDTGHYENRCPRKICTNCGSTNNIYSTRCSRCSSWTRLRCPECGQFGHPKSHCPDLWRRYHNTIDENVPLEESRQVKKHYQMFCSGCTRRGHLVHNCRSSQFFSGLPINSPYVSIYRPIYPVEPLFDRSMIMRNENQLLNRTFPLPTKVNETHKRQHSKSLSLEEPTNKRINISESEYTENDNNRSPRTVTYNKLENNIIVNPKDNNNIIADVIETDDPNKAPDFIPISSNNHDKKGQLIQDNEISDTSNVITSARIYLSNEIIEKLKTSDGSEWLKSTSTKNNVSVQYIDTNCFLNIKGNVTDQEIFHSELREWAKNKDDSECSNLETTGGARKESYDDSSKNNIPKNRNTVLRKLSKSFEKLENDFGDPQELFQELNQLQNNHKHLMNQKFINPCKLNNNRTLINTLLKRLNIILIGQAGLGDGSMHLNELYNLQKKIINLRQKNIPLNLREEIGHHYHHIFTAVPRDDYTELLQKYTTSKQTRAIFGNDDPIAKTSLRPVTKGRTVTFKKINPFSLIKNKIFMSENKSVVSNGNGNNNQQKKNSGMTKNKLIFYRRKIINSRPVDQNHKKIKLDLVRKLHFHIASLTKNDNASSKSLKKMKKTQAQAQLFLSKF